MNRLLGLSMYSKKLLLVIIFFIIDALIMFSILCFDVIQLIVVSGNKASISKLFLPFNMVLISLAGLTIIAIILMIIIFYVRGRSNGNSKN